MVVSEFPPNLGGVSFHVFSLCKALIKKGHKVTVLTRGSFKGVYNENIEGINIYRITFVQAFPFHIQLHGYFVNSMFKSLEDSFDVVHMHIPFPPFVHTSLPMLITVHTLTYGIRKDFYPNFHFITQKFLANIIYPLELKILDRADGIVAVSSDVAKQLYNIYGLSKDDIEVAGNAVDIDYFFPERESKDISYVLFAGRLVERKGLTNLIESAATVCKEYPSLSFVLAGEGPLKTHLMKLAKRLGLSKKILFPGQLGRRDMRRFYQNATIFVLPSYSESFPNVLLEAMACGLPCISTPVGDIPRLIFNGENGFLVPPKNTAALTNAILNLLGDEALRRRMGEACRWLVENHYSCNALADKILDLYKSVIA